MRGSSNDRTDGAAVARPNKEPEEQWTSDWYKDAVIYQLHVRAFFDRKGDGVGDFAGLAEKLDYLRDLGVTAIWLQPFYPSPLRDDGYDIAEYTGIHPDYGTLRDFRFFLKEAHRRNLKIITELVLNHTSDRHPWFQRSRNSPPGSTARNFYVWRDSRDHYGEARIIFKDFESSNWAWDPISGAYYWHRFYSHQPDLNYDNPAVRRAMHRVVDFWLRLGVDGLRLDAVPYLFERDGTNCENLPETHLELKALRKHVDSRFPGRMLLAEANQWPEDAVSYFGRGDECHMAFHFPVMPRMFMAVRMEDRYPIIDILSQTPSIPDGCQWAVFLRNHDELTLEMVTDEERDYMYRVFAKDPKALINLGIRRRLAPLLNNDRRQIELMNGLLLSLGGTPVIYYGDEIGMGDNIYLRDRNGVRTPMQWSADRNAGFSRCNSQKLYLPVVIDPEFHYEAVNVDACLNNPNSLLWWMRRLIALRRRHPAFGRGKIEFLYPENSKILAFVRTHGSERLLVVANLSRYTQCAELDLREHRSLVPVEMFGQALFPPIGEKPYFMVLGPHSFHWFSLESRRPHELDLVVPPNAEIPVVAHQGDWSTFLETPNRFQWESILRDHLTVRRWFGGKGRLLKSLDLDDVVPLPVNGEVAYLILVRADFTEGDPQTYIVVLGFATGARARSLEADAQHLILTRLQCADGDGVVHASLCDPELGMSLLDLIGRRRCLRGLKGEVVGWRASSFQALLGPECERVRPTVFKGEQRHTSLVFGRRLILKVFRRVEEGTHPDVEIGQFLGESERFPHCPLLAGAIEYRRNGRPSTVLGVLHEFVPNDGDAWTHTLDDLTRYFERVVTGQGRAEPVDVPRGHVVRLSESDLPPLAHDLIGVYLEHARLLGRRTAELHRALASNLQDPALVPEPFTPLYQRSLYQSIRNGAMRALRLLRNKLSEVSEDHSASARLVVDRTGDIIRRFGLVRERKFTAQRIRLHGDFHLGQVLWTGKDFVIVDFEGDSTAPLSTRRIKRSPLRDVAAMIRSFHYAAHTALLGQHSKGAIAASDMTRAGLWADYWQLWVSSSFLRSYLKGAAGEAFLPREPDELEDLLSVFMLEKALFELEYELTYRPEWVGLPLAGILRVLG